MVLARNKRSMGLYNFIRGLEGLINGITNMS